MLLLYCSGDDIPILRLHGGEMTPSYFRENGFSIPILVEKKDGLGLIVPPSNFRIQDVENNVGRYKYMILQISSRIVLRIHLVKS